VAVTEVLINSIEPFADASGLSDFFVSAVIVAIAGNAAEHGGAVVIAARGGVRLASEIALQSASQVAVGVIPAVVLLSLLIRPLPVFFSGLSTSPSDSGNGARSDAAAWPFGTLARRRHGGLVRRVSSFSTRRLTEAYRPPAPGLASSAAARAAWHPAVRRQQRPASRSVEIGAAGVLV